MDYELLKVIELDSTSSTNSFARDYYPQTQVDMLLVTAEYQSAGRGQATNTWESDAGQNLLFTLAVWPKQMRADNIFALSEAIALSIREAIQGAIKGGGGEEPAVCVKWPNDIYVGDRKIAGILIENDLRGAYVGRCIIGCGVDINQRHFRFPEAAKAKGNAPATQPTPVSLFQLTGRIYNRQQVLDAIVEAFQRYYSDICQGIPDALEQLHAAYLQALYRREGLHAYADATGPFTAEIADVEPSGYLILRDSDGQLRRYAFKEVTYLPDAPNLICRCGQPNLSMRPT